MYDIEFNRGRNKGVAQLHDDDAPRAFHRRLPDYEPTQLLDLPGVASDIGVRQVVAKDERFRFGLTSFKFLGASWATYRAVATRLDMWSEGLSLNDLRRRLSMNGRLTLVTATLGNHGLAVARMARLLGIDSQIFLPAAVYDEQAAAIGEEGAKVIRVEGDYDEAVGLSAAFEEDANALIVSDTAWGGHTDVPFWIVEGYSTIFWETDDLMAAFGYREPTHVFVQIGVGALASSVVRHYRGRGTVIVGVEPLTCSSLLRSARAGTIVELAPDEESVMARLNCGIPSVTAWPVLLGGVDAFLGVEDRAAIEAVGTLAAAGVPVRETGAAGLAGLLEVAQGPDRDRLQISNESTVLVLLTEGIPRRHASGAGAVSDVATSGDAEPALSF